MLRNLNGVSHFSGLQSCGSVWMCPACAAKVRQARAEELEGAIESWLRDGGGIEFVTLTVQHSAGETLASTFDLVADGWRKGMLSGQWARDVRSAWGIPAWVRTIEVTYGVNGWHPHIHALMFTDKPWTARQRALRGNAMFHRWSDYVARSTGKRCSRDAFRIVGGGAGAGKYIAKLQEGSRWSLGTEFTRGDLKTGRAGSVTPFEFIAPAHAGEAWALHRWWEWEEVTQGRRCMTWSKGGRLVVGLDCSCTDLECRTDCVMCGRLEEGAPCPEGVREKSDEELAAEEVGGEDVCAIEGDLWHLLRRGYGTESAILDASERGGALAVGQLIADLLRGPPI